VPTRGSAHPTGDDEEEEEAPLARVGTAASPPASKPAAATAGRTEAPSGSGGQK